MTERELRVEKARLRAHGRETLQRMGLTEADLPADVSVEQVGYIKRPDECLPHELTAAIARGKVLARRYGW